MYRHTSSLKAGDIGLKDGLGMLLEESPALQTLSGRLAEAANFAIRVEFPIQSVRNGDSPSFTCCLSKTSWTNIWRWRIRRRVLGQSSAAGVVETRTFTS